MEARSVYELELVGTFVLSISSSLEGPRGLDRPGIEELIEQNWGTISMDSDVLLESEWELIEFTERRQLDETLPLGLA